MKQLMHGTTAPQSAPICPPAGPRRPVLLLGRQAVAELLPLSACIEAVEAAFRLLGEARVPPPGTLGPRGRVPRQGRLDRG